MNRRHFLLSGLALGLAPGTALAQRGRPARFSVELVTGNGPDVVLIPGLTAGRDVWRGTVAALPGYRYHLLQVAGFAREPARGNAEGPIVSPLADEIARYMLNSGLRRPAVIGHSMGGTLAMLIAARNPELAGRIMVVDMLPEPAGLFGGTAEGWGGLAEGLGRMLDSQGGRRLFANIMNVMSPPDASARNSDPNVVGRAMRELAAIDLTPQLPRIRAPMTVVYASPDRQANAALDRGFARAYAAARNARLQRIDGSGHMVMLDQPARFRAAMRTFLGGRT